MNRYSDLPLPARPHVPGSGSEPDRAALQGAKADAQAFRYGVDLFNHGFFWEAHEVWEAVWRAAPPNSGRRQGVRALIQMANALLKRDMKKPNACRRLADEAARLTLDADLSGEGLDIRSLAVRFVAAVHGTGEFPPIVLGKDHPSSGSSN